MSIGNWINCLEVLGQVNVVTNTAMLFFTHRNFKNIFIEAESNEFQMNSIGWEVLYFLMFLVVVEHLIIALKVGIKYSAQSKPDFVKEGERERAYLIKKFTKLSEKPLIEKIRKEKALKGNVSKVLANEE